MRKGLCLQYTHDSDAVIREQISLLKCKPVVKLDTEIVCVAATDSTNWLDLTLSLADKVDKVELKLKKKTPFGSFGPMKAVYLDFERDYLVVKARSYNADNVPTKEAALIYKRTTSEISKEITWGLASSEYFEGFKKEDIITSSIPVVISTADGTKVKSSVIFTQSASGVSSYQSRSLFYSRKGLEEQTTIKPAFKQFTLNDTRLSISDTEIYEEDAKKIEVIFNKDHEGNGKVVLTLDKFFGTVNEKPGKKRGIQSWMWILICLGALTVVSLIVLMVKQRRPKATMSDYMASLDES